MVSVPVRAAPLLASTVMLTVPGPLALPAEVTRIHAALLTAVHAHAAAVDTVMSLAPPAAATVRVAGPTE